MSTYHDCYGPAHLVSPPQFGTIEGAPLPCSAIDRRCSTPTISDCDRVSPSRWLRYGDVALRLRLNFLSHSPLTIVSTEHCPLLWPDDYLSDTSDLQN
jgi:hypothetical protein